ncbi:MAG TPA: Rid family detoxifying hydrolase [Bacteroidales bacterium]|nr:Rid family detoxifying hydrolase [Bacteroidales bacterium]
MNRKDKRIEKFFTVNAPEPAGHYSQAVIHDGIVYVSGQLPVNPFTGEKVTGSIEEQTRQVLENIGIILKDCGSSRNSVLKTTVYVSDISLWGRVNEVYGAFFGDHKPARAVVPVKELHFGFLVEIEAVAII